MSGIYTDPNKKKEEEKLEKEKNNLLKELYSYEDTKENGKNASNVFKEINGWVLKDDQNQQKETTPPASVDTTELTGSDKYLQMQKEYIEKYLGRDPFEYDVNADEVYKIYRDQALKQADRARRDTVAQAAGLTGGYGSSYAAAAGSAAYNDVMEGVDAMIPELYEAAKARYNAEGAEMLDKANMAGSYAAMLQLEENGGYTPESDKAAWEMEQKLKTAKGLFDYEGDNDTGATTYDEAMRIYAGVATGSNKDVDEDYLGEHKDYTEAEIRNDLMSWKYLDADGKEKTLSYDEVNYLTNQIMATRELQALYNMVSADGTTLEAYTRALEGKSATEIWDALEKFRDKSGYALTEDQIGRIMEGMLD